MKQIDYKKKRNMALYVQKDITQEILSLNFNKSRM